MRRSAARKRNNNRKIRAWCPGALSTSRRTRISQAARSRCQSPSNLTGKFPVRILNQHSLTVLFLVVSGCYAAQPDLEKQKAGAEKGDPTAEFALGLAYAAGNGVPRDLDKAVELYRKAADHGNVKAMNNLGACYANGSGVERDDAKSAEWYRKAAEKGSSLAQDNLGSLYLAGHGVSKNAREAANWFRKAAEQNFLNAQVHLGKLYYFGDVDLPKNYSEAAKWLEKAADHGSSWAQNTLGLMYQQGFGLKQDLHKAVELYRRAAEHTTPRRRATSVSCTTRD